MDQKKISINPKRDIFTDDFANNLVEYLAFEKGKIINDSVHGHFELPDYCLHFVDTRQFQRLRDLKQIGTCYYVFPGASHNRFEHCLGVSHLAHSMVSHLQQRQPNLRISTKDKTLVSLAGLCHDLGHGPFSHAFEEWLHDLCPTLKWHHEDMSKMMLDYLIEDNYIDMETSDVNRIKELIKPDSNTHLKEKPFLFDIVANYRNSVDVDKFDYLARDCKYVGMKYSYDFSRLLTFNRVVGNEICFHEKEAYDVYQLFHVRYNMHKQVYTHRVSKAIEYMIMDALTEANPTLKITDMVQDPKEFLYLNDTIVSRIESSREPELENARKILVNLRRRVLYRMTDEYLIPPDRVDFFCKITAADFVTYGSDLKESDVIINISMLSYSMKEKNPVDNVRFYRSDSDTESISISREGVSNLSIPNIFAERYFRVFVRDKQHVPAAQAAFRKLLQKVQLTNTYIRSPTKQNNYN